MIDPTLHASRAPCGKKATAKRIDFKLGEFLVIFYDRNERLLNILLRYFLM